jgi:transposase
MRRLQKNLKELVKKSRTKGFYEGGEQRNVNWDAYTSNQITDILDTLAFIRFEVESTELLEKQNLVGRPPISPKSLAKAILFVELLGVPERKAEGWLLLLKHHLGITEHIDDRVLGKAYSNSKVYWIIRSIFNRNLGFDGAFCGDGSGLEKSRKENYESTKNKGLYITTIVDSRQIVQSFSLESTHEKTIMFDLVRDIAQRIKKEPKLKMKLTLDAGFVDRKLAQLIAESGLEPYIFPKSNLTLKAKSNPAWKKMLHSFMDDVQNWLKEYHIRSNVESFFSSLKRIFGIVTKHKIDAIYTQVLCRIIHNNRRKLNYYQLVSCS